MRYNELTESVDGGVLNMAAERAKKIVDNYFAKPDTNKQIDANRMREQVAAVAFRADRSMGMSPDEAKSVGERVAKKLAQSDELLQYIQSKQA